MGKKDRITVQDIADALSLSRNTVSKALNNQYVPPRTRERVLSAAIEMGYKSYGTVASTDMDKKHLRIVLITSKHLMTMTFFIQLVRAIELRLDEMDNVELLQFTVSKAFFFDRLGRRARSGASLRGQIGSFRITGKPLRHTLTSLIFVLKHPLCFLYSHYTVM